MIAALGKFFSNPGSETFFYCTEVTGKRSIGECGIQSTGPGSNIFCAAVLLKLLVNIGKNSWFGVNIVLS